MRAVASRWRAAQPPRPANYPASKAFRPRRAYGPFLTGSDLHQMRILLNRDTGAWNHNGFFASVGEQSSLAIYKIYYGATLPAEDGSLQALLNQMAPTAAAAVGFAATEFVYGFIHDQYQNDHRLERAM